MRVRPPKSDVDAYIFSKKSVLDAIVIRTAVPNMDYTYDKSRKSVLQGIGGAVILMVIAVIMRFIFPMSNLNAYTFVQSEQGSLYVRYWDELHPVLNVASARLILGKPETARPVKNNEIHKTRIGALMGIPGAPEDLTTHPGNLATWTSCNTQGTSTELDKPSKVVSTFIAGAENLRFGSLLQPHQGILAIPGYEKQKAKPDKVWLIHGNSKSEINTGDIKTMDALGIEDGDILNAIPLSPGLFNLIPETPKLQLPAILRWGNKKVGTYNIGDILVVNSLRGGKNYYLWLGDAVQKVTYLVAILSANHGAKQHTVPIGQIGGYKQTVRIDTSMYPDATPQIVTPKVVCYVWSKLGGSGTVKESIVYGDYLPSGDDVIKTVKPTGYIADTITLGSRGWFIRVVGNSPDSIVKEQYGFITPYGVLWYIDPDEKGLYAKTVQALGLSKNDLVEIPNKFTKLVTFGGDMGFLTARVEIGRVPAAIAVDRHKDDTNTNENNR